VSKIRHFLVHCFFRRVLEDTGSGIVMANKGSIVIVIAVVIPDTCSVSNNSVMGRYLFYLEAFRFTLHCRLTHLNAEKNKY
jgi:hypothetical protein